MPSSRSLIETKAFLAGYEKGRPALLEAAAQLKDFLSRLLGDANVASHMVSVRVKEVDSVRGKLLRKEYSNPSTQLTDAIGARIILYRGAEVDRVTSILRTQLRIRERDSIDKRLALGLREFGYRSYHIIGQLQPALRTKLEFRALGNLTFEIQVRSILEHVWAEIEHSIAYKSGAELPAPLKRRFASLAAVLEMLEHEFASITSETSALIEVARAQLSEEPGRTRRLDVPFMLAWLERTYPEGRSFRQAAASPDPFPPGIEQRFLYVLQRLRLQSTAALSKLAAEPRYKHAARVYSAEIGESPIALSHLARLALVVGVRSSATLETFFPELNSDLGLNVALYSVARRGAK